MHVRGPKSGKRIEIVPFDNKGTVQDSLIVCSSRCIDEDISYIAATISSVANALTEAVLKHNTRNPDKRGALSRLQTRAIPR